MCKNFLKYMTYGKHVISSYTNEEYVLTETYAGSTKEGFCLCVSVKNYGRYSVLRALETNGGLSAEGRMEKETYETELLLNAIQPADRIRFIRSNYEELFSVKDFGFIEIDGKVQRVVYLSEYHFAFLDGGKRTSIWHICQFAEFVECNGICVKPIGA